MNGERSGQCQVGGLVRCTSYFATLPVIWAQDARGVEKKAEIVRITANEQCEPTNEAVYGLYWA